MPPVVIVGGGLAGATAAAALRQEGFDGRILLFGAEPLPPYERPPLSKEFLRGERSLEDGFVRPVGWYDEAGIEARFGTKVERLDAVARELTVSGGERVRFDQALVATGVRNRRLDVPGADLPGVFDLRSAADAERIREAAVASSKAVIVGAGFIGCEVASSLRAMGLDVAMVEFFQTPLHRVLGGEIGRVIEALHRDHGVHLIMGESVDRIEGRGRFEAVVTHQQRRIEGDLAIVGVGTEPVTDALSGLAIDATGGVAVGPTLETSVPGVFAVGDVASHDHPVFGRVRVEHFDNAVKMGEAVARSMLGRGEVFDDVHWFWSDQYDANLQVAGFAPEWDEMVVRGSLSERRFAAFLLKDGVLRSTVTLDWPRDARRSMPLIRAQVRPDPARLRDPEVDLRTLAGDLG